MENYTDLITTSAVVVVEFYADWCPHCQRMMPVVDEVKELLDGQAALYQLNVDRNRQLADALQISGTPTFIIYRNGEEVWRHSGEIEGNILYEQAQRAME